MSVDKFNSEGYYDPTAYEAMSTVEKEERALRAFRPIVYICSPYAGEIEKNVKAAQEYSRFAVEKGYIPIAPHLLFPAILNSQPQGTAAGLFFATLMSQMLRGLGVWQPHLCRNGSRDQPCQVEKLPLALFY